MELARSGLRPTEILTPAAFDNAITVLMALGGSTNAVIHLLAIARKAGVQLSLERFDQLSAHTPLIANLRPSGEELFARLSTVGGIPGVLDRLQPLLDTNTITVTGKPLSESIRPAGVDDVVLSTLDNPFAPSGGIAVVKGNLAPDGALIKTSAATPSLLRHRGPALVFDDHHELSHRIDDPDLDVTADTVLVLRNVGPTGGPGMPEWGALPLPEKLLRQGVTDMVRISDARMSGTCFGTMAVHVAPEAAADGPLAKLQTGDPVVLDVDKRLLAVDLPDDEFLGRPSYIKPRPEPRGYRRLVKEHMTQADKGCDFDFMIGGTDPDLAPASIPAGWHGGW